jgi:hypothetical protein
MQNQNHRFPRILFGALFLTHAFVGTAGAETEQRAGAVQNPRPEAGERSNARTGDASRSSEVQRTERDPEQTPRPDRTHARDRHHRDSK